MKFWNITRIRTSFGYYVHQYLQIKVGNISHGILNELPRANNSTEWCHTAFQANKTSCQPAFYSWIEILRREEIPTRVNIQQSLGRYPPSLVQCRQADHNKRIIWMLDVSLNIVPLRYLRSIEYDIGFWLFLWFQWLCVCCRKKASSTFFFFRGIWFDIYLSSKLRTLLEYENHHLKNKFEWDLAIF